ncbi:bifunctional DNA primase/polymerase [Mycolicibacter icosiumassiliensis]|uniref:bifunctional DNA primase/polymerase n=1 Tax=Mycolicibacter icosiumassiliensis TaxID=1792835 RepID=UPI00082A2BD6|nr:bifunctional DNA primase/polymerase [Mycolicibacter icosiumassiliensis]
MLEEGLIEMLGGRTPYDLIAARPAGDFTNLKQYVEALGKAGIPLVFLAPGTKDQPIDLRTPSDMKADNLVAQEAAKAAGNPRWAEVKTNAGIKIATADPKRLGKYVTAAAKRYPDQQPNIAMLVQNLLVADCDWAEGVETFRSAFMSATGEDISPTVLTPGVYKAGEWKHYGGGHFYFTLPDGWTMPEHIDRSVEMWEGNAKTSLFIASQYVLIPPSVRPEGPYQWVGEVRTAPPALLQLIEQRAAALRVRVS